MTHLSESFKKVFSASHPDNPFLSVMLQYHFLTAQRIAEDSCGSDGAGGECVWGGFHSDTKAMKRLDWWSVQWVLVCVFVCAWLWCPAL